MARATPKYKLHRKCAKCGDDFIIKSPTQVYCDLCGPVERDRKYHNFVTKRGIIAMCKYKDPFDPPNTENI